ncbi:MAG: 2-amino-4-hydroxy-6-hydroxymethyldihydropteridine diphosphokinase [Thermoanaerobaculia bacterium]
MTSTSSRTRSTSSTDFVVIALGSNLGDRRLNLARAVHEMRTAVRIVRLSRIHETDPVDAPAGSQRFFNMVVAGYTALSPEELMASLLGIEARLGRIRRGIRNAPRIIDLDVILFGATLRRSRSLTLPHPRYRDREFVTAPLRELRLPWRDPVTGEPLSGTAR